MPDAWLLAVADLAAAVAAMAGIAAALLRWAVVPLIRLFGLAD